MAINLEKYTSLIKELDGKVTLVAVSKTKPIEEIQALYDLGQRDFGENYVQELVEKEALLPKDIRWHFIGHLQSNKVKYIAPFVYLIHGVDSVSLLQEINKQGVKNGRIMNCLLQVHIAREESKYGFNEIELEQLNGLEELKNICIRGVMGMASFSKDKELIRSEFATLKVIFDSLPSHIGTRGILQEGAGTQCGLSVISMGMSGDYPIAMEEGSNMVRIGSLLFGERNYNT